MIKRGDILELGNNRVMCGDATNPSDIKKLMEDKHSQMLFTSPPYGDLRTYSLNSDISPQHLSTFIKAWKNYTDFLVVNVGLIRRNYEIVPWWQPYLNAAKEADLKLLAWNVWDKLMAGSIGNQSALFPIRHEWLFVFGEKYKKLNKTWPKKIENVGRGRFTTRRKTDGSMRRCYQRYSDSLFKEMESVCPALSERGPIREEHPAVFPLTLPSEYIKAMTNEGDIITDCFAGSGTTLIAAEKLGRTAFCMEMNPKYCELIQRRWENYKELNN